MKNCIVLLVFFALTSVVNAQLWVRNFILPSFSPSIITSSVEWKDNIYVTQSEVDCAHGTGSRILKLDSEGNILAAHTGLFSDLLIWNERLFGRRGSSELVKIDKDLRVIDSLMIPGIFGDFKKSSVGFEILTLDNMNVFHLIKVNGLNALHIESNIDFPLSSIQQIDTNFYSNNIGDMYYFNDTQKFWFFISNASVIMDSLLQPLSVNINPSSFSGTAYLHYNSARSFQLNSGNVLTVGNLQKISTQTSNYFRVRKWGTHGNVIDSLDLTHTTTADTQLFVSLVSITEPSSSVFYAAATSNPYLPHSKVIVTKVDTSLNLLWMKTFEHPNRNVIMYHISGTNDGGALISGATFNWVTPNDHSGYLIRIDSSGAILTTNDLLMRIEKDFICYPNPAQNDLYFSAQHDSKPIDIEILDMQGKLVYQAKQVQQSHIDIQNWTSGFYIYQVRCKNRLTSGKIVKE